MWKERILARFDSVGIAIQSNRIEFSQQFIQFKSTKDLIFIFFFSNSIFVWISAFYFVFIELDVTIFFSSSFDLCNFFKNKNRLLWMVHFSVWRQTDTICRRKKKTSTFGALTNPTNDGGTRCRVSVCMYEIFFCLKTNVLWNRYGRIYVCECVYCCEKPQ